MCILCCVTCITCATCTPASAVYLHVCGGWDIDGRVWAQMAGVRSIYYASTGPHRAVSYKLQTICRLYKYIPFIISTYRAQVGRRPSHLVCFLMFGDCEALW